MCNVLYIAVGPFFFWPLCCMFFFVFTDSDYLFGIFKLFLYIQIFLMDVDDKNSVSSKSDRGHYIKSYDLVI